MITRHTEATLFPDTAAMNRRQKPLIVNDKVRAKSAMVEIGLSQGRKKNPVPFLIT